LGEEERRRERGGKAIISVSSLNYGLSLGINMKLRFPRLEEEEKKELH